MTTLPTVPEVTATYGELCSRRVARDGLFRCPGWRSPTSTTKLRRRWHKGAVVRRGHPGAALAAALERINPAAGDTAYEQAIEQLTEDRSKQIPVDANQAF